MSFAENLIDGLDVVYKHSTNNTKAFSDIKDFLSKMASERKDYEKRMTKLVQDFRQKKICGPNSLFYGTVKDALESYLNAIEENVNTESAITNVFSMSAKDLENQIKEYEKQAKGLIADGQRITKDFEKQKDVLKKDKDTFVKLSKDADSASVAVEKAMQDQTTKVNKMQQLTTKKESAIEKAKEADQNYRATVQLTNERLHDYYNSQQPNTLSQFQAFEETIINAIKDLMTKFGLAFTALPDAYSKFVEFTKSKFDAIDADADINTFATTKATNGHMPDDFPIEDASGNILFEGASNAGSQPMAQQPASYSQPQMGGAVSQPVAQQQEPEAAGDQKTTTSTQVKALYDYTAEAESELTIHEGDILVITEKHSSGWWFATNDKGQSGFVPENYVEPISA
ncbi:hypothetical protein EIN_381440 [Entamoeba invadens IP1]|uniref:Uncharacterized protein n=1 Tax=Entamoeba invadens IP1 TaxID=370355 RepID=A0A0A1UAT7_ENTIV|nr:hypothetical protein EIN_381440 [Entamoeba invadens IP1]ELP92177.1 hypothetical protein EIN_381440 [Entamoeba invadens IP1]|eukprot:XP_004258948.1 hypothetical protein EIN_381440 [Entamoeba invadens IP1]